MRGGIHVKIKAGMVAVLFLGVTACVASEVLAQPFPTPPTDSARRLPLLLRKLDRTLRLLSITAHPDDEDAGLLAYYAHGQGMETALLTLTRGEGGQNEIGTELGHALGVLRSRESQAARRYDGARQYLTRAFEFGYSFSVEESLEKWGEDGILQDIVAVIREFRPDVIVTLTPDGPGGGQHHQASAQLARRAMLRAANPKVWPFLGEAHRTARLFRQIWGAETPENLVSIPIDRKDTLLGTSYAELGSHSRGMHRCQGMVRAHDPFFVQHSRLEWLTSVDETPRAGLDLFEGLAEPLIESEGVETAWGAALRGLAGQARARHRVEDPGAILDLLLGLKAHIDGHPGPRSVRIATLERNISEAILHAAGLELAVRCPSRLYAAGETVRARLSVRNSGRDPVSVSQLRLLPLPGTPLPATRWDGVLEIAAGERRSMLLPIELPVPSGSGWSTAPRPVSEAPAETRLPDRFLSGIHPRWSALRLLGALEIRGRSVMLPELAFEHESIAADFPELRRDDVHVVPDPSLRPAHGVIAVPTPTGGHAETVVEFRVSTLRGGEVEVSVSAPEEWSVEPARRRIMTREGGVEVSVRFRLRGKRGSVSEAWVAGSARHANGKLVSEGGYQVVDYPHIRRGHLVVDARVRVVPFTCQSVPRKIGYVTGTGDDVARCLQALGHTPVFLERQDLLEGDLGRFDVIVTGVRAYKVRDDLKAAHGRLMSWVENGGTLIVQYNKLEMNAADPRSASPFTPWRGGRVSRRRVTVEESPVKVLLPDHPVFRAPNAIGEGDWASWVQERGLYFLDTRDERYRDLVELEDPWPHNAGKKRGALVEARLGKGRWLYVGLGLFRQLPAGVPGAYRLTANLLALGAED